MKEYKMNINFGKTNVMIVDDAENTKIMVKEGTMQQVGK